MTLYGLEEPRDDEELLEQVDQEDYGLGRDQDGYRRSADCTVKLEPES